MPELISGSVLWGANNIFVVLGPGGQELECRLKGKQLKLEEDQHNPLSPGDLVHYSADGMIHERLERNNAFHRWNRKHGALQTIAANIDRAYIVASVGVPPFRPRFVDRALIAAAYDDIPSTVILNKTELGFDEEVRSRLAAWRQIGIEVQEISVHANLGIEGILRDLSQGNIALLGQSGAGKSSLINALIPERDLRVGEVSTRYQRGRHTTTLARAYRVPDRDSFLIDTPGIRELDLSFIHPQDLPFYFVDFEPYREECALSSCSHDHEPDCAVSKACDDGALHPDRYESYLRILDEIREARKGRYD